MKIALYKDVLANNRGAASAVRNLAAGLAERGHDVTLFEKTDFAEKIGRPCDVLVSAGPNELLDIGDWFANASNDATCASFPVPVVHQFHTDPRYAFRHWFKKWRRHRKLKQYLKKCTAIQVLRKDFLPFIRKIVPDVPVCVIGNWSTFSSQNATDPDHPSSSSPLTDRIPPSPFPWPTIVYPAALNKDKNQKLLQAAFKTVQRDFPDWRLELYGKGTANGFCDLRTVYAHCAFVAFPSKTEGLPLALLDAACFGKPCVMIHDWIGTAAAGGGIVTDPTIKHYAAGLRRLMSDADLRKEMGAMAKKFCETHYSRAQCLDQWETLLSSVTRGIQNPDNRRIKVKQPGNAVLSAFPGRGATCAPSITRP